MLLDDTYAVVLLVNHDLYEDDEFVRARAYVGSCITAISTARYNPELDEIENLEREHTWPASHCCAYMKSCCANVSGSTARPKKKFKAQDAHVHQLFLITLNDPHPHPFQFAMSAHRALPDPLLLLPSPPSGSAVCAAPPATNWATASAWTIASITPAQCKAAPRWQRMQGSRRICVPLTWPCCLQLLGLMPSSDTKNFSGFARNAEAVICFHLLRLELVGG